MVTEVNTYINEETQRSRLYPEDKTMLGMTKNKMFVFYNLDHLSRDHHDFTVTVLIDEMLSKYHLGYTVEFVQSDINKVVIKQRRKKAHAGKLRLTQIKANHMLRELVSYGKGHYPDRQK